jgi:hypothetical protein
VAKHALNTSTSSLLSTSEKSIVPTGALPSLSFLFASFSISVRPPARDRPSTHCEMPEVAEVDEAWMEGRAGGRYHRSNFVVPM